MYEKEERLNRALELGDININEFLDLGEIHQKMTPLYYAVNIGSNTEIVKLLCSADGIDVNKGLVTGRTPLAAAVLRGRADVVKVLLECDDVEVDNIDRTSEDDKPQNGNRETPLHLAVKSGNLEIVKILVKQEGNYGPDPNTCNRNGDTALHFAVKSGNLEIVKILVKQEGNYGPDPNICNRNGDTALHFAVKSGNLEIVKILVKQEGNYGPDPNICNRNGDTALHLALKAKSSELAEILLEETDLNLCDRNGNTMIHLAIPIRNINLTSRIFEQIDEHYITAKNKWGETALRIYTQIEVNSRNDPAEYLFVLRLGLKTISDYESKLHRPPQFKFNEGLILDDIPKTLEMLMVGEAGTTVLAYLHEITNDKDASEDHKANSAVLMKFIIRGIKDNVENERLTLWGAFYKESNLRDLVQIFVDTELIKDELDLENLLNILYKSLQANIKCDFGTAELKAAPTEWKPRKSFKRQVMTDCLKDKLEPNLLGRLRDRLEEMTNKMGLKPSNQQLIARNLYRTYFKGEKGKCCSPIKDFFGKKEETLSSCLCINKLFHKCIVRGNFSFIPCA